jgi:hypothetical protein
LLLLSNNILSFLSKGFLLIFLFSL